MTEHKAITVEWESPDRLLVLNGHWDFDYRYFAGEVATRFFAEIRDNARIMGIRCGGCGRVLVPARAFCDRCYVDTKEWVEVGPEGTVESFTILSHALPGFPDPPVVIAYATLDGADTAIVNFLMGVDLSDIDRAGRAMSASPPRIRTAFAPDRTGTTGDFVFELV